MKKKILAIVLCFVFTWGACVLWNWAEVWAEATDTNAQLFDAFAAICLFAGLACSCLYFDEKKNEKAEIETPDE